MTVNRARSLGRPARLWLKPALHPSPPLLACLSVSARARWTPQLRCHLTKRVVCEGGAIERLVTQLWGVDGKRR